MQTIKCPDGVFPKSLTPGLAHCFEPRSHRTYSYAERVDRNIGWITTEEQQLLRTKTVGIAGCGGMGGILASILVRLGIGEMRIADSEVFDASNINRQLAASRLTIGSSKATETARALRGITEDYRLIVYPDGITAETVTLFVDGCDLVLDEVEFWALSARIQLHQCARQYMVPVITCSSVGLGTRLFLFDHGGMAVEDMLSTSLEDAKLLEQSLHVSETRAQCMQLILAALIPEIPQYSKSVDSLHPCVERLLKDGTASIMATTPPLAAGFAAIHALSQLLGTSGSMVGVQMAPKTPGYLYLDAATMQARVVEREEVGHE